MSEMQVTAERREGGSAEATYDMPDDVAGMIEKFGEEVVFSHVKRSMVIALQSFMRSKLDAGAPAEDIQAAVTEWKPGTKRAAKSPIERAREEIAKMSPADRAALAKEMRKAASQAEAA